MESVLMNNIKKLYENELYSSVIQVASLLSSLLQNDRTVSTPELEYQTLLYHGNASYYDRQYRLAIKQFNAALVMRKTLARFKNAQLVAVENVCRDFTEEEIRYRVALCHRELGESTQGLAALQAIPFKMRSLKVHMLYAKLVQQGTFPNNAEAITAYKEVLKDSPLALVAIDSLLMLGADGSEVNTLVMNAANMPKIFEWLTSWIKGHALMYARKHLEASRIFTNINTGTKFRQNEHVVTLIGKSLYYHGNFAQAQLYLESAALINPYNWEAIMPLAVLYEYNQKLQSLEKLTAQMTNICEFTTGHWFVMAQNLFAHGELEKATSFVNKALTINIRNIEAQLLRGKICLHAKRYKHAINFFRAAQCLANYRFEVYKGLFHCYVGLKRCKEAQTMCALAVRYFRSSPRSYVLFARTLVHSSHPQAKRSAKRVVSKALEIDEYFTPAVALMAEICQGEGEAQEAITLLRKQLVNYPHYKLFTILGDILASEKDIHGALDAYTTALSMEPTYRKAMEGVNALGKTSWTGNKGSEKSSTTINAINTDEEWLTEVDEPSIEALELSSPAVVPDDADPDAFADPFWQDVDADLTNQ